ncbi:MAG: alpha-L-fucosidase [Clostridia bacterium]|nr:alpha-L-fucosidase [Clostridia bacterium]
MNNREWFQNAKFGMMIHWGLYSLLGGEWKGRRMPHIGEWAQSYFKIPNREYHELTKVFHPMYFCADDWVKLAKEAGMKYLVLTAKHHEGFAMYHSKVSDFNVCDRTPYGKDIVEEFAESCAKHGLKLGLYYSQELDWSEEHGGGYCARELNCGEMSWDNNWDFPDREKKDFSICFERKIKPQVTELLTNYGEICLMWFDTPFAITKEQSQQLYDLVKSNQPDCLVNSRIGNGLGDYGSAGDNQIGTDKKKMLYEVPATLNDTWGYKSYDNNWKSADRVKEIKEDLNAKGINYLLNIGPDYLGRIPVPAIDILKKVGQG